MTGDDALVLAKGVAIGLMVAAPVGPVNVLCARRALEHLLARRATGKVVVLP